MENIIDEIKSKLSKLDILDDLNVAIKSLITTCAELKANQSNLEGIVTELTTENFVLKTQVEKINSELDRF